MRNLPPITKKILLINLIVWLLDSLLQQRGLYVRNFLGLWSLNSGMFHVWQPLTYMFLHANFGHIFCNMFAVLVFGPALEESWGERKYILYYLVCGLGAAAVQLLVWALTGGGGVTIGASGAVFGILFAFGWLFPDVPMFILFIPVPIRARTMVLIYAAFELVAGLADFSFDNVAHFAHLGGLLFGWLLILIWRHPWHKFPRIKREKNDDNKKGKDFSDYHYQEPIR
ncbi:MAG: rhomboid family intramembrane serine protease [Paludibacteraceae bacterium]|nr:rhomboid family intramembrane serine protease [Paludibacteraceae bacterium]